MNRHKTLCIDTKHSDDPGKRFETEEEYKAYYHEVSEKRHEYREIPAVIGAE